MKTLKQRQQETGRTLSLNGAAWRRLRAAVLEAQPLCACGCGGLSTDVDHIDNDPTNNDRRNLAGMTHECHAKKTQQDLGKRVTYGCDADGMPLDPDHPWYRPAERSK